jgi:hypothetical protein
MRAADSMNARGGRDPALQLSLGVCYPRAHG